MRVDTLSTNFSAGELSPRLYGRPDLAKYGDAVKRGRDVIALQHGGMIGRPGTDYLGDAQIHTTTGRLVPFVYSTATAYILEFGDEVMRVWKDGELVGAPYELITPYADTDLAALDFTQGADTMFISLQTKPIHRLRRFADDRWVIEEAPFDPVPFAEIGRRGSSALTLGAVTGSTTATSASAEFLEGDVGRDLKAGAGRAVISAFTATNEVDIDVYATSDFDGTSIAANQWVIDGSPQATLTPSADGPVGAGITLLLDINGWRPDDVGRHVQINGGLVRIYAFTSAVHVTARVLSELSSTTPAPPDSWSLEASVWNEHEGYPSTVTLHQQRLIAAGSPAFPQTVWGSKAGLYLDFTRGVLDDDSYSFEIASDEINPIRYLVSGRDLVALTYGGEWLLSGGIEKPITPTNVRAMPHAKVGCADVRPEQIGDDLFFAQRGATALRTLSWSPQIGAYQSAEASTLSEHLFSGGFSVVTYQQSPERVAWIQADSGAYIAMTVSTEQNIRAFTLCTPAGGGVVESMATIPEGSADSTYMLVRRTINGSTKRYIERMNWDARQDCRVVLTPASATVTGLSHLAGKSVAVVADGEDIGDFTVSAGGSVTLSRSADEVSIGLRFVPTIKTLSAETGTGMGASAGRTKLVGRCAVLFQDTVGCSVNGYTLAFREFGEAVLDSPIAPYSGWKDVSEFGWRPDADEIEITQPQCYPIAVLSVVRRITTNPG